MGISEATFRRWKQLYGALVQPSILLFELPQLLHLILRLTNKPG
jgi:hypothetical protein